MKRRTSRYGFFSDDGREFVITTPRTPRPWVNVVSNGDYGIAVSQTGSGYSWRGHAQLNRLTRWEQDLIKDEWGKYIYLREGGDRIWSAGWKPVCAEPDNYRCIHGIGYTLIESSNYGIETSLLMFVPNDDPLEIWHLTLRNTTRRTRRLDLFTFFEWGLGQAPDWHREFHKTFIETAFDTKSHALFATKRLWEVPTEHGHWNTNWPYVAFHSSSVRPAGYDSDKESFLGMYGSQRMPASVVCGKLEKRTGNWLDPIGSLQVRVTLKPGEEQQVAFTLGAAGSETAARKLVTKYRSASAVRKALAAVRDRWDALLSTVEVQTPDAAMDIMENIWLKYQAISGRLWGRTAYYQTGGAYGFRDQLQDSMIFLPIDPAQTKQQIQLHARHQFSDGGVYHWWHPMTEIGLRNQISDNMLWLPFVVTAYLDETAELAILDERLPFVDDPHEVSLYDHCARAIDRALERFSPRGLPLIGAGDWNDGLSAVGLGMKGESIWLGHFLYKILRDFSDIASLRGDREKGVRYETRADTLKDALNTAGWDGGWYYGATKDSGQKLGSKENTEGRLWLNPQTWAIIAGVADEARAKKIFNVIEKKLEVEIGPLLLTPAYRTPDEEIGYLTRYGPGQRENGGVYTHGATWAVIAATLLGRGASAYRIYSKLNPINRGMHPDTYYAEPYVTAGNIEGPDSAHFGRGGWTWYSGSAAWLFKVGLEWILGIRGSRDGLIVDPCIPAEWDGFRVRRIFRGITFDIEVRNKTHIECCVKRIKVDGEVLPAPSHPRHTVLPLFKSGTEHRVLVELG